MFSGLKNFAINRVLRHVADNAKLNYATNGAAILLLTYQVLDAVLNSKTDFMLVFSCCSKAGSLAASVHLAGVIAGAITLWLMGKFPGLNKWLPVVQEVLDEAQKEVLASAAAAGSDAAIHAPTPQGSK